MNENINDSYLSSNDSSYDEEKKEKCSDSKQESFDDDILENTQCEYNENDSEPILSDESSGETENTEKDPSAKAEDTGLERILLEKIGGLSANLESITHAIIMLQKQVTDENKLKGTTIELYNELQMHKKGFLDELMQPILSRIIRLYTKVEGFAVNTNKIEDDKLKENFSCIFESIEDEIAEILESYSIKRFSHDNSEDNENYTKFDPESQTVSGRIPTQDKEKQNVIECSVSAGFNNTTNNRILKEEGVNIYVVKKVKGN